MDFVSIVSFLSNVTVLQTLKNTLACVLHEQQFFILSSALTTSGSFRFSLHLRCSFVVRPELCLRWRGIQRVDRQVNARTSEILATIDNPLENGDKDDDGKCSNAVVWHAASAKYPVWYGKGQLTHVASGYRARRGKHEQHSGQDDV